MIRATIVYLFVGIYVVLLAPLGMFWAWAKRDPHILYALGRACVRMAGCISGIRVTTEGREKIKPGQTYVFLSNHLANLDGPVLCHVIPRDCRALIKQEIMRLPLLALVFAQAEFVAIDRRNPQKARSGIELGAKLLAGGRSFFAFPEGTRSRTGRLGEFKKGVFIMAIKAQVPVMPITILGSDKIQRPGEYRIRPGTIRVVFHDPIPTEGMCLEDRNRLIQMTREAIASAHTNS